MGLKHHVLSTVREDNSSPERPATPTRSSPPSASRSSLRRSQSHSQLDARQPSMLSRGSSPNLAALNVPPDLAQSSGREDTRRKSPAASWQNWRFWRSRPLLSAMILVAALGTLLLLATSSFHGLRARVRPHRGLMSQGIPSSLMLVNVTAAYAQSFCSSRHPPLLLNQSWTDGPMCHFGGSQSFKDAKGSGDACGALVGVPKVAMLFLATKGFAHSALWAMWFQQAGGLLPADCAAAAVCTAGDDAARAAALSALLSSCGPTSQAPGLSEVVDRQHLFSVYVHLPPNKTLSGPPSIFHGREIPGSIPTAWGEWSLANASRVLIREALKDKLNQRFIMLSESCAPLYPPAVVYQQLMYERKSRINACDSDPDFYRDNYRYTGRMQPELEEKHWRKSFQWFGVVRKHAVVIAEDEKVAKVFEQHCTNAWDDDRGAWRSCFSDEHYFATVLATKGLDEETDCKGGLTHTEWCDPCTDGEDRLHPRAFKPEEVSHAALGALREERTDKACNVSAALGWAADGYVTAARLAAGQQCGSPPTYRGERAMLGRGCPLFARKFPSESAAALLQAEFMMLVTENGAQPQGLLVPDNRAVNFGAQCKALRRDANTARKQLILR
ncbi:probable glycosyltransferase BC10 at C-terminar half [Coccomyxa sp. Obi]|nr:probable glycosyltransferase BC10 at C-terminar half [Coccomyxa sp. Obi]